MIHEIVPTKGLTLREPAKDFSIISGYFLLNEDFCLSLHL